MRRAKEAAINAADADENTDCCAEGLANRNLVHLTVQGLIRLLSEQPPDLRVVVDGYESGYDDLSAGQIQRVRIALHVGEEKWVGDHEEPDLVLGDVGAGAEVADAVVLRRRSR